MENEPAKSGMEVLVIFLFIFLTTMISLILGGVGAKYAMVIAYPLVFTVLIWNRPDIALMLIFALAPFQQMVISGLPIKFGISEITLAMGVPAFLFSKSFRKTHELLGPITIPVILYLAVCLFSSILSWRGSTTVIAYSQMIIYAYCAVIFSSFVQVQQNIRIIFNGIIVSCLFLTAALFAQKSNYIFGLHKNGLGSSLAAGTIICAELWWTAVDEKKKRILFAILICIATGLLFTLSRGAWLGALFGVSLIMALRKQLKFMLYLAVIIIPVFLVFWSAIPQETKEYVIGFTPAEHANIQARFESIEIAKENFLKNPVWGVGVGLRKEYDASNVVLDVLAETGIAGFVTFILIHISFYSMVWKTQKRLDPASHLYSILVIGAALHTNRLAHALVDHYWTRGASMLAWAGTGMAIGVYFICRDMKMTQEI